MKTYLHKLREGFIITSDEHWETGDSLYDFKDNVFRTCKISHFPNGKEVKDRWCKKVIAQQDQIDFSGLSIDDQKKIGWFDVKKLAAKQVKGDNQAFVNSPYNMENYGFDMYCTGFQKAQYLLSDRMFTLEDMHKAIAMAKIAKTSDGLIDMDSWINNGYTGAEPLYSNEEIT